MKKYIIILCLFIVAIACSDNCEEKRGYYASGELKYLLTLCDNNQIGNYTTYYKGGVIKSESKILNKKLIGIAYKYRENGNLGVKQVFNDTGVALIDYYYDSNEVLFEINAYRLFDNNIHAKKVFLDKNIIDTVESDFVKLKRIKNKLEIELISKNPTYKDSIRVYFLNDLNDEYYKLQQKSNRSIIFSNTRKFTLNLTNDDFVNNRCNIYIQTNKYYECDKTTTSKVCRFIESFYVQFDKDDYDIKDNLTPIY